MLTDTRPGFIQVSERNEIFNRDGLWWFEVPRPRRWHRCFVQTYGYITNGMTMYERCPCGATCVDGVWLHRNSRRSRS